MMIHVSWMQWQRKWFEFVGEAVSLRSSVVGIIRSDWLEKLPATREATRFKDGKLHENTQQEQMLQIETTSKQMKCVK